MPIVHKEALHVPDVCCACRALRQALPAHP